jgi:mannan endo-1,4-beta-mannosidase
VSRKLSSVDSQAATASPRQQSLRQNINQRPTVAEKELGLTEAKIIPATRGSRSRKAIWISVVICAVVLVGAVVPVALLLRSKTANHAEQSIPYLGVYSRSMPLFYTGVTSFGTATRIKPNLLMYYSSWNEPFQVRFATTAAQHGAEPIVQINPYGVSLAAVASGQYDSYLSAYAKAIRSYRHRVILSFGHEMNGNWYPWAHTHASPTAFVAAWRHIVSLFRQLGALNVTWLWTVNIIDIPGNIPSPASWWPGSSYVNWVGIDGYYYGPSVTFASLFGPTITAVRELTKDPIIISETAVAPAAGQSAKIPDLFAGIRLYGLLGLVWFDVGTYHLSNPSAIAAFHKGAEAYQRSAP